jgi:hypothetical protein
LFLEVVPEVSWDVYRDIASGDGGRPFGMSVDQEEETIGSRERGHLELDWLERCEWSCYVWDRRRVRE